MINIFDRITVASLAWALLLVVANPFLQDKRLTKATLVFLGIATICFIGDPT